MFTQTWNLKRSDFDKAKSFNAFERKQNMQALVVFLEKHYCKG